jgi:hypothetical protein
LEKGASPCASRGDVLAEPAVAARRASLERAVVVQERHAEAVHLGLADVAELHARQGALDPGLELAEVRLAGRVLE